MIQESQVATFRLLEHKEHRGHQSRLQLRK
jgi:hypothetical protein